MKYPKKQKCRRHFISRSFLTGIAFLMLNANAAIPPGYYDTVDTSTSLNLRTSLHEIIDDHQRFPYTSTSTDTWDILETADENPDNPSNIIDIYKNASYTKEGGGNSFYNREHTWPKSYGFPDDGSTNYAYTDTHHLFLSDSGYNSSRSNKPYANCDVACSEKVTLLNNNRGGGPTDSNWTAGSFSAGSWETWDARKGDVARALMYMDVRYEGGVHNVTSIAEPDLILTDDRNLIDSSNTGSNISVAYMGLKSVLLQWHKDDPVDDFERRHTDAVFSFQGNRNPFIDHPEYVECIFENNCSGGPVDTTPPGSPTALNGTGGSGLVDLTWNANTETDLAGYNVYRSETSGSGYVKINGSLATSSTYTDNSVTEAITYYYVVTAVDTSSNESGNSNETSAIPDITPPAPTAAWINEFHYDNNSTDTGEFAEIAGTAGLDLSGWSLVGYNGNGGTSYKTVNLSGVVPNQQNGFGTLSFSFSSMQNGSPDGLALVDNLGGVVQFLSYEGTLVAVDGPANGLTSVDVGVSETSSTPVGHSLQLSGTGQGPSDFTWQTASTNTSGQPNTNQTFDSGTPPQNQSPTASFTFQCNGLSCTFDGSGSSDNDGQITGYTWAFGDGNQDIGATPAYTYISAGSYTVTLTVTDDQGATGQSSQTVTVTDTSGEPSFFENTTIVSIPDRDTIFSDIVVNRSGAAGTVDIAVNITHTYRGDIGIILHAPNGSKYTLKSKDGGDGADNIITTYTANVSGNAQGTWTLEVEDHFRSDTGQLNSWSLQF